MLINCAGVFGSRAPFAELRAQDFISNFTTNAVGPFMVTQQLHRVGLLGKTAPSLVVHISTVMASLGDNSINVGGSYAYRYDDHVA